MLDLIELTNREVIYMMCLAYVLGTLTIMVCVVTPLKTKLDTLVRNAAIRDFLS